MQIAIPFIQKTLAIPPVSGTFPKINAKPDDNRKTDLADSRRTLESCADYTRGGGPPTPDHDADIASRSRRLEKEQQRLIQWAETHGRLGKRRLPAEFARGGEHQVYFQKRTRRYLKATLPSKHKGFGIALGSFVHGATPSEYLDRLNLQNIVFNDDIRLERIIVEDAKPIIITSQPAIRGKAPEQADLDRLMATKGYELLAEGAYYDGKNGLLIFDLFPRNAVQIDSGIIYPIDPVIQRVTDEFAQFLREHPNTINNR